MQVYFKRFGTWMSSVLKKLFIWDSSFYDDKWGISVTCFDIHFHSFIINWFQVHKNQQEQTIDSASES